MAFANFLGGGRLFGAWAIAFKIPNLSRRLFGEGAASASFIPVYSEELHHRPDSAKTLACTVVTVVAVILAIIALLGEAIIWIYFSFISNDPKTDLMLKLASIMLPYMILICVVAILAGILNTHRHFAMPAAAPMVLNIFIIGSLCFSGWIMSLKPGRIVYVVAVSVVVAGIIQLLMQIIPLRRNGIHLKPSWQVKSEGFRRILILMGPMIIGLTATQINTLADDIIAWIFSSSAAKGESFMFAGKEILYPLASGVNSHLYLAQRLYQFPLGLLGISLATAIFPVMSADAAKNDMPALVKTISRGLRGTVFVAVPATAGLILVRNILVQWAFERGEFTSEASAATSVALLFYSFGLCGFFLQQIVTRAFYSLQQSKAPARTAMIAVCINLVLNMTLIWYMGAGGLALSTALCSYVQVILLVAMLKKQFNTSFWKDVLATLPKIIIATALMYAAGSLIMKALPDWPANFIFGAIKLILIVAPCTAVYTMAAKLLKIEALSLLLGRGKK